MGQITWARRHVSKNHLELLKDKFPGCEHWSRQYEYPWILEHGEFESGLWVLDAAGGDGPLQKVLADMGCHVINMDLDHAQYPKDGVLRLKCDLRNCPKVFNRAFDRITCISVLEHDQLENPRLVLGELWGMLAPGGRLLVTLDVASYVRFNHTIDKPMASSLISLFDLVLPPEPEDILVRVFPEIERKPDDPTEVALRALCFWVDKPVTENK